MDTKKKIAALTMVAALEAERATLRGERDAARELAKARAGGAK